MYRPLYCGHLANGDSMSRWQEIMFFIIKNSVHILLRLLHPIKQIFLSEILLRLLSSIVFPFGPTIEQEVAWVNASQSSSRSRVRFLGVAAIGLYLKICFLGQQVAWVLHTNRSKILVTIKVTPTVIFDLLGRAASCPYTLRVIFFLLWPNFARIYKLNFFLHTICEEISMRFEVK